jgi:hypothetical protein
MSENEFDKQIAAILRRLETLRAVQRGDLKVKRVPVKKHFVPGFWVGFHKRNIVVRPKRVATVHTKRAA